MGILKLKPACKDYLWGGNKLKRDFGKEYDGDVLAETWELSCHPDGPSMIVNGKNEGKSLRQYLDEQGMEILGDNCEKFEDFPILTKFIDAKDNLSIQVHPDNEYALKNEGQYGKTEMWYIMDCEPGAFLYFGFKREVSKEEFVQRIADNTLLEVLNDVPVKKGDVFFIEAGTIHAIGKNILLAEIQQNSNVTYRVYDYGRVGKDGKARELHVDKAVAVTNLSVAQPKGFAPHLGKCEYFTVDKLYMDGSRIESVEGSVSQSSFLSILVLDGSGTISCGPDNVEFGKGDSLFLPAGSGNYKITGQLEALLTTVG